MTHSPISSGTGQHFVDADHMERMNAHTNVELVLAAELHQILVAANAASFQRFRAELFILVRHEMHAEREIFCRCLLTTEIEDTDLRIRHTTTET